MGRTCPTATAAGRWQQPSGSAGTSPCVRLWSSSYRGDKALFGEVPWEQQLLPWTQCCSGH